MLSAVDRMLLAFPSSANPLRRPGVVVAPRESTLIRMSVHFTTSDFGPTVLKPSCR
jgi:hypothetical protein